MTQDATEITREGDWLLIFWHGEVDMLNAATLEQQAVSTLLNADAGLVIDLSAVDYIDSVGIRVLLTIRRLLVERQQRLFLVLPEDSVLNRALEIGGVPAMIDVCRSLSAARDRR